VEQPVGLVGIKPEPVGGFVGEEGAQNTSSTSTRTSSSSASTSPTKSKLENSEMVFVGYGVQAPELNWDDFRGIDVKGKTIVVLVNDPPVTKADGTLDEKTFGGKAMTYYGRWTYKYEKAAELGAAGVHHRARDRPAGYRSASCRTTATSDSIW
jgi:hypothetical protein